MYIVHNVVADSPVVSYYSCCCYRLFVYRTRIFCTFPSPNRQLSNKNTPNQNEEQPSKEGRQPASKLACLSSRRYVRLSVCPPAKVPSIHPAVGSNIRPSVCSSNHSRFCFPSTASKPSSCSNTKNVRLFAAAFLWLLQFFCILSLLVLACGICCKMRNFTFVCVIESKNLHFACFFCLTINLSWKVRQPERESENTFGNELRFLAFDCCGKFSWWCNTYLSHWICSGPSLTSCSPTFSCLYSVLSVLSFFRFVFLFFNIIEALELSPGAYVIFANSHFFFIFPCLGRRWKARDMATRNLLFPDFFCLGFGFVLAAHILIWNICQVLQSLPGLLRMGMVQWAFRLIALWVWVFWSCLKFWDNFNESTATFDLIWERLRMYGWGVYNPWIDDCNTLNECDYFMD